MLYKTNTEKSEFQGHSRTLSIISKQFKHLQGQKKILRTFKDFKDTGNPEISIYFSTYSSFRMIFLFIFPFSQLVLIYIFSFGSEFKVALKCSGIKLTNEKYKGSKQRGYYPSIRESFV